MARLEGAATLLQADARTAQHARRMKELTNTTGWRLTAPLRRLNAARKAGGGSLAEPATRTASRHVVGALDWTIARLTDERVCWRVLGVAMAVSFVPRCGSRRDHVHENDYLYFIKNHGFVLKYLIAPTAT